MNNSIRTEMTYSTSDDLATNTFGGIIHFAAAAGYMTAMNLGVLTRNQLRNLLQQEDCHEQMAYEAYIDAHFPPLPSSDPK